MAGIPVVGRTVPAGQPLLFAEIDRRMAAAGIPEADGDATVPSRWPCLRRRSGRSRTTRAGTPPSLSTDCRTTDLSRVRVAISGCSNSTCVACAHRLGCLSEDDHEQARKLLDDRFTEIVATTAPRRAVGRYELPAPPHSACKVATKTEDEARAELNGHTHDDWMLTMVDPPQQAPPPTPPPRALVSRAPPAMGSGRHSTLLPSTEHGSTASSSTSWSTPSTASFPRGRGSWSLLPRRAKASSSPTSGWPWRVAHRVGLSYACKRPVLYLALEDGHRRLQSRFRRILDGGQIPEGIEVVTEATPGEAIPIIAEFMARHPTPSRWSSSTPSER